MIGTRKLACPTKASNPWLSDNQKLKQNEQNNPSRAVSHDRNERHATEHHTTPTT